MKICFVFSNRSEYVELEPFISLFKTEMKVDEIDLKKKIRNLEHNKSAIKIYQICFEQFTQKNYDYVCVLGDRKELPHVAFAAFYTNTKIIHFAAGEYIDSTTTLDQYVRPIITILSSLQICFSKEAVRNVKKLFNGISYLKDNAHCSGNPIFKGVNLKKIPRKIQENYDLVLLHPQSLSKKKTLDDIKKLKKGSKEFLKEFELEKSKMNIQRFKGLGEMNPEELWSTTLNPETRNLLQVQYSKDTKKDQTLIHTLMGNDVALRKDFIVSNAINVQNLDI